MKSLQSISADPLKIHYHDDEIVIVEKPAGQFIHPPEGQRGYPSTMNILRDQIQQYVYPVHRLDRPVSGVCIFALTKMSAKFLKERWNSHEIVKKYLLLCRGIVPEFGYFNFPLKKDTNLFQESLTIFQRIDTFHWSDQSFSLVEASLKTGRKHQIRRHFSRRCFNLVGDTKYGKGKTNSLFKETFKLNQIFLHSFYIKVPHPNQNNYIEISSPMPENLDRIKSELFNNKKTS